MYTLHKEYIAKSISYGSARKTSNIKYIVFHYTGNSTDKAVNNAKYYATSNTRSAGAHYFVDDTTVYQSINDTLTAWAVGGKKLSSAAVKNGIVTNANSISIEMCSTNGVITEATQENAIILAKNLMKTYNISVANICRHYDVTGKKCPGWTGWCGADESKWNAFKAKFNGVSASTTQPVVASTAVSAYTQTQFIKDIQSAIGATVDGKAGPKTLAATPTIRLTKNNKHAAVIYIQKYLNSLGYDCGTPDGSFGTKTDAAVKKYQTWMTKPDGEITSQGKTWKKLLGLA